MRRPAPGCKQRAKGLVRRGSFRDNAALVHRFLTPAFALIREPRTREFLCYCLPALILGLTLRVLLIAQLPMGIYHDDTPDFIVTADRLLHEHRLEIHAKKTFLVPLVFSIPFLLHVPALVVIPLFQHALGLGLIVLTGLLCRLWFVHWKWFIVPLTCATAANPFILWYEHTLMAESLFVVCTVLVAFAGTLYALAPTRRRFVFLCVALVVEAGARPEGKLLFGFGIFLVALIHARAWRTEWPRVAGIAVLGLATHFATRTSQAGLLLYTSVAKMTPTELRCAPGFDPYIAPIRAELQARWTEHFAFPKVRDRRAVSAAVAKYLKENPGFATSQKHQDLNSFCLRLAMETCRRNLFALPQHAVRKFRAVVVESPAGWLDGEWLLDIQREAFVGNVPLAARLGPGLSGRTLATEEEIDEFLNTNYREIPWFNNLNAAWLNTVNRWRFPDTKIPAVPGKSAASYYFGVPYFYAVGAIGLLAAMLRRGELRALHFSWGLTLLGFFFVIMLTANVRPRFRFVFEPFWCIYIALLAETAWLGVKGLVRR